MANIIIIAALAVAVGAIVWKLISDRRNGKSDCGCSCGDCAMKDQCHKP